MAEVATSELPLEKFRSNHDIFREWIKTMEDGIVLTCNPQSKERKDKLCILWLPLMLDSAARTVWQNVTKKKWEEIKVEMEELLVDPQERYNWKAGQVTVIWDEKESFHELATRVRRCMDLYEPDADKPTQYFYRFRLALPPEFRYAIDTSRADDKAPTLEKAKAAAFRFQMAISEMGLTFTSQKSVSFGNGMGKPLMGPMKAAGRDMDTASFAGATMKEERLSALERGLEKLTTKVNTMDAELQKLKEAQGSHRHASYHHSSHHSSRNKYASSEWDREERRSEYRESHRERDYDRGYDRRDRHERDHRRSDRHERDQDRRDRDHGHDHPDRDSDSDEDFEDQRCRDDELDCRLHSLKLN